MAVVVALAPGAAGAASVVVREGMLTAQITAVRLADLKSELEAVAAVEIRIANAAIAQHPVTASVVGERIAAALDRLLRDFNFVRFTDARSGRLVYLVTSLADPGSARPAVGHETGAATAIQTAASPIASASPGTDRRPSAPASLASASESPPPRSLDQVKPIVPPAFAAYAEQGIIDSEIARVREETLARAHAVLGDPANGPELQRQALNELAGLGDPKSLPTLQRLISDSRVLDTPQAAEAVAQAAWRYAAQQQFANADANRLLQVMADSSQPGIRSVGESALRDAQNFLAKNPNR